MKKRLPILPRLILAVTVISSSALGQNVKHDAGNLGWGVAGLDGAGGKGFIMFSKQQLSERLNPAYFEPNSAEHFLCVHLVGDQWQFASMEVNALPAALRTSNGWTDFTPTQGDVLVAEVDYRAGTIKSLKGTNTTIGGINAGYVDGDLRFAANRWKDADNFGEYEVKGTYFETTTKMTTNNADPKALAFEPPILEFVWVKGSRSLPASKSVQARNAGGSTGWKMDHGVNAPSASTKWVTNGIEMKVSVNPSNLDVGVHEKKLVMDSNGMSATLPVKITVVSAQGKLEVNRKRLNFGGFLGDSINEQTVDLNYTGIGSINWTVSGNAGWLDIRQANAMVSATDPTKLIVGINAAAVKTAGNNSGKVTVRGGGVTHEIEVNLSMLAKGSPTIQLDGLEVTQGIQNLYNEVPFVAERPTFVRAHVRSLTGEPVYKVTAQLSGTRDGKNLGTPLSPANPGGRITIGTDPNREKLNESFLFELPKEWLTGTVTLSFSGKSHPIAFAEPAEKSTEKAAEKDGKVTLTYQTIPALPVEYVKYTDTGTDNKRYTATDTHALKTSDQLLAGLPVPSVKTYIHPTTSSWPGRRVWDVKTKKNDNSAVLAQVTEKYKAAGSPKRHFYALFANSGGPGGIAGCPGFCGQGQYSDRQPMATLNMHEIGHNLGRQHVGCNSTHKHQMPNGPDPKYPVSGGLISQEASGPEAYFGFNVSDKKTIYPPTYHDYMTYGHADWVSPYSFKGMMEHLKTKYVVPSQSGKASGSPGSPILLVSGGISESGVGRFDSVVDDNASAPIPAPEASQFNVRLYDANGNMIATYPVTPEVSQACLACAKLQDPEAFNTFTLAVPRPENMARVELLQEDKPIAQRNASANAPAITLTTKVGGEKFESQPVQLSWDASDADGDELSFNVDYSIDDGTTWNQLARNWSENNFEVDSALLPGSATARLRVSANDGFRTTFAVSEAFTVVDHRPIAVILNTHLHPYYVGGQTIMLKGVGYDLEDGEVNNLAWYSDRHDGALGTGPKLELRADDLAEGPHVIRLEAKDRTGQSSLVEAVALVANEEDFSVANDTVNFSVLHDPEDLPPVLEVTHDGLYFSSLLGGAEPMTGKLSVRNLGDGDLSWTATGDADHVTLSSNSGDAPAEITVTVNPVGLDEGLHGGVLTFTPADTQLKPVTVEYVINVTNPANIGPVQGDVWTKLDSIIGDVVRGRRDFEQVLQQTIIEGVDAGEIPREMVEEFYGRLREMIHEIGPSPELPMAWEEFKRSFREHLKDRN